MAMTAFGSRGTLSGTEADLIATGSNRILTSLVVSNTSASAVTITIKLGAAGLLKTIVSGATLAGNSSMSLDFRQYISSSEKVTGLASTGSVVDWHISGVVVT